MKEIFGVHNPKRCIFQAFPSVFLCNFPPFLSLIHFFPYISLWYVTSSMMKSLAFTRLFRIFLLGRSSSSSWKQKIFSVYLILIIFIKNVRSQITFVSFSIFLLLNLFLKIQSHLLISFHWMVSPRKFVAVVCRQACKWSVNTVKKAVFRFLTRVTTPSA